MLSPTTKICKATDKSSGGDLDCVGNTNGYELHTHTESTQRSLLKNWNLCWHRKFSYVVTSVVIPFGILINFVLLDKQQLHKNFLKIGAFILYHQMFLYHTSIHI